MESLLEPGNAVIYNRESTKKSQCVRRLFSLPEALPFSGKNQKSKVPKTKRKIGYPIASNKADLHIPRSTKDAPLGRIE